MPPIHRFSRLPLGKPGPHESAAWEIEHHLAELADRLVAEGWDEEAARREAERRFGDRRKYRASMTRLERGRKVTERWTQLRDLGMDGVASVLRTARRYPVFTAGVVVTLALGIGANATMYGIVDRLLLRPPDHVVDHEAVRRVLRRSPDTFTGQAMQAELTYPDVTDLKAHEGLSAVAAYRPPTEVTVGSGPTATRVRRATATWELFPLLGVRPALGRFFSAEEDQAGTSLTAVISREYWERAYGADADVLGRSIEVEGRRHEIIGVAPAGFTGVDLEPVDLWLPLEATLVAERGGDDYCLRERRCSYFRVVVRLADGVGVEVAEEEATRLHHNAYREAIEQGEFPREAGLVLAPLIAARGPDASAETRVARWLTGVSSFVLLIVCANVANLLLARGTRRRREIAVRLALGVARRRLVLQTIVESTLLGLGGGGLALVLAWWGGGFVRSVLLPEVYFPEPAVTGRVVAFTAVASVVAGLVAGLAPAVQGSRLDVTGDLTGAGRGASVRRSRLRASLTVSQAALSVILLVGAGLFVRSLGELRSVELGLDMDRLLRVVPELEADGLDDVTRTELFDEAVRRVETLPSVESAVPVSVPFQAGLIIGMRVPGLDSLPRLPGGGPWYYPVSPGYFETVGVRLVEGRAIETSDGPDAQPVAVVSETMARTLWPGQDPLGQCLLLQHMEGCTGVVGVAEDAARRGYRDAPFMAYYVPMAQSDQTPQALFVRTKGSARAAAAEVAPLVRSFSPLIRYADVRSLEEILRPEARSWTLGATMFSIFGVLALALAAVGLYGLLAFDVAQRTRELGIRKALGARRSRLLGSVVAHGGRLGGLGVLLGLAAAYLTAPYAGELLFEVSPRDPGVFASVAFMLVVVSLTAGLVPGMRATQVDPVKSLRTE